MKHPDGMENLFEYISSFCTSPIARAARYDSGSHYLTATPGSHFCGGKFTLYSVTKWLSIFFSRYESPFIYFSCRRETTARVINSFD